MEESKRRDEVEEKRKDDLDLAKLQAEKEIEIAASSESASPVFGGECVDRLRLPAYKDGDDCASYHTWFERIAELIKVDKDACCEIRSSIVWQSFENLDSIFT